jgi:hypothetical protein
VPTDRTERQAAQEHFIDLCRVLGEPTPNEAIDPDGYTFEKGDALAKLLELNLARAAANNAESELAYEEDESEHVP